MVFNHERGSLTEIRGQVRVIRCAVTIRFKSQPISWRLWRCLNLEDVDLVHLHAPNFFSTAALLLRLWTCQRDVPVVITHHSDVIGRQMLRAIVMPLYSRLALRARAVIVTSDKYARLSADIPSGAKIVVIPLGIHMPTHVPNPGLRAEAAAWRNALCGDAPTIAFVGRHVRYKGLDVLVRALAQIPEAHLLIAGDGPLRKATEHLAAALGVGPRTHFLGAIDETQKLKLLAAADAFAFPSTEVTEAFGIALLEAMAAGVPVVATDLPTGVTDIARHGETALVVPPADADALAAALQDILSDRILAARLTVAALARVQHDFNQTVVLDNFCGLIENLIG